MCVTAFCRRWLVPLWAGPSPPRTQSPFSPSTCCPDSLTWVLPVTNSTHLSFIIQETPNCSLLLCCTLLLQVEEFISRPGPSLFFNTQMHEQAAHTFPNISPLMQRAVTFPHNLGGWSCFLGIPRTQLSSAPCDCEGWRWRELTLWAQKRGAVSGLVCEAWRLVHRGIGLYVLILSGYLMNEVIFPAWINVL